MKNTILNSIREAELIETEQSRRIFADYGLHPEEYPILKRALENYNNRISSQRKVVSFGGVHDRDCPACGTKYFGGNEICDICLRVYRDEDLFWKQGKIIEEK